MDKLETLEDVRNWLFGMGERKNLDTGYSLSSEDYRLSKEAIQVVKESVTFQKFLELIWAEGEDSLSKGEETSSNVYHPGIGSYKVLKLKSSNSYAASSDSWVLILSENPNPKEEKEEQNGN